MEDFSVSLLMLRLIYTARVFIFQETEAAVQAKQPNVEEVLSKGCHLYNIHYCVMGYASPVVHLSLMCSV